MPVDSKNSINELSELRPELNKLSKYIINKAILEKVIIQISKTSKINYALTERLLLLKIIRLEDINLELFLKNEELALIVYDEKIEDNKIKLKNITKEDFNIKLNKKVQLFI